jgi:hypothetical protein
MIYIRITEVKIDERAYSFGKAVCLSESNCLIMKTHQAISPSIVACLNGHDGSVFRVGVTSHLVGPSLIDPLHIMLGVECGDWGVCLYLAVEDAARLNEKLAGLLANHSERG